jgi:hypothetical protein
MTADLPPAAVISLSGGDAALIAAASERISLIDEDPFSTREAQGTAREVVAAGWPGLADLAARVAELVCGRPHCVLLRGVPLVAPDVFFVALTRSLGDLLDPYQQSWSRLIHRIRPRNDRRADGGAVLNEHLHTDGTDLLRPNDLTCLLCERPDQNGGGRSRLLPLPGLVEKLRATDPYLLELLSTRPVPWQIMASQGGSVHSEPAISGGRIRWLRHTIDSAVAAGAEMDADVFDRLDQIEH